MVAGERTGAYRWRFAPRPSSVAEARRAVRSCLEQARRDDVVETAELLVSEVVTNAVVHAGTVVELGVSVDADAVRIEVRDGSPHSPAPRDYAPSAGTGRGLMLLEELSDWGVTRDQDGGKTVWFRISGETVAGGDPGTARSSARGESLVVRLLRVPLLLHQAWQQHAESLLREHLLVTLDQGDPDRAIAVHAEASDALAVLAEHVPRPVLEADPEALLVRATEPHVTAERVEVPVPRLSVAHFHTLEAALLEALEMVEQGGFLTPPTQPEVQALRAWLCGQVLSQSEGAPPEPWQYPLDDTGRRAGPEGWDCRHVTEATAPILAADDENRIIAVSAPAADLLGYVDPGDLVGHRLLEVIPPRYRQAHLAGFTMHLLTGRSPLLGRTVAVPALRRDGSEVRVGLTVSTEPASDGHRVFVARLDPLG